jgi:hypothetical protein
MTIGIPTLPPAPEASRGKSRGGLIALALVLLVSAGAGAAWWRSMAARAPGDSDGPVAAAVSDSSARAPQGTRIRVRVLNISGVQGLARRATAHLRAYGFDVVDFGSGRTDTTGMTRVSVHTGHEDWAARVQKALGVGVIDANPDTSRYVDLTVFVGRDWRPSTETLRP